MDLAVELQEKMQCETVFTIPILGGIHVTESVVVSWIIMAVIALLSFCLTRNLRVTNISKRQALMEFAVTKLDDLVTGMVGEEGKRYVPYLATVLLYIGISNVIGVFGFKPPTKDINVTVALAVMSILLIEGAGIRRKGIKKWFHHFTEPTPIITALNVMELVIRPLSLCMRLFGNVLGAFVVMKLLEAVVPVGLPVLFSFYFDFFDGLLQAYVFVFLTSLFLKEAIE